MIKKQKFVTSALLLSSVLLLNACGDSKDKKSSATDENGVTTITLGRQTIQNPKLPDGDTYEDNAYTRLVDEKLNVKLESAFEANGDDYDRQLSLAIASGDLPDMMVVNSRDEVQELVDNDLIADLSDVYDEYASDNIKKIYDSYDNLPIEEASFDEELMAIPGTSLDFGPGIVWLRQDWIDELGLKLDEDGNKAITLDELKETAKTFQEKDPDQTGKAVGLALNFWLTSPGYGGSTYVSSAMVHSMGAYPKYYLPDENGQIYYGSTTPEMKDSLEMFRDWYEEGILDPQFGTRTFDDISAMVINGETGVVPGPWHLPDWNLFQVKESNPEADFIPYAIENANDDGKINSISDKGAGSYIVVSKDFEKPELAMEIVNLIYDEVANAKELEKDYPDIYAYSKKAVDGTVRPFNVELGDAGEAIEDSAAIADAIDGKTKIEDLKTFGMQDAARTVKDYMDDPESSTSTDWAKYHSTYLAQGKTVVPTHESGMINEITPPRFNGIKASEKYTAQLNKLEEETFIKYIIGEKSLDDFDNFVEQWKKQGGNEVLKETQEAYEQMNK